MRILKHIIILSLKFILRLRKMTIFDIAIIFYFNCTFTKFYTNHTIKQKLFK